jgi:hypothetical protein
MEEEAAKAAAVEIVDPWRITLERVRGKIDFFDGLERISSQTLLDLLEVPQRNRTAGTYRRLAKVMAELGWTAVRVRDLTRGGYREQIRGYCRDARTGSPSTTPNQRVAPNCPAVLARHLEPVKNTLEMTRRWSRHVA